MPSVSIIIPCYNSESFIKNCLESLLSQEYTDFEVLLVNDGSTDSTGTIIDEYSKRDCRFKAIHKQNGGVSSARNAGLNAARGEWICFVDSDDILKPDALNVMLASAGEDCDITFAGFEIYKNNRLSNTIPCLRTSQMNKLDFAKELFTPSDYYYQGFICSKIYKREIIEKYHIRFDEKIIYNEDRLFTLSYIAHIKKGFYTTQPVYEYYINGNNAMSSIKGPSYWKFETDLDAFIKMNSIIAGFGCEDLCGIVRQQTYNSYRYNRWLNKKYGNNDRTATKRLKSKILTVLAPQQFFLMESRHHISTFKSLVYNSYRRFANNNSLYLC